ncbi:tetratricopeptide repeat protein, partial [Psychrosphaera sp.]|nr:tetratricopeptide repeat protein [Psychrosphaera sp.]
MPSKECLAATSEQLKTTKENTLRWFNLKLLQIESLITIKEFAHAERTIDAITTDNLPPLFSSYLTIYKAKVYTVTNRRNKALELARTASINLVEINNSFYSPLRSISIANLLLDMKRLDESLEILLLLKEQFQASKDNHLKLELFGNLGHAYRELNQHQQSLESYLTALSHAKALKHHQQTMVIYSHIGKAYMYLDNPQNAELMLKELDGHHISIATSRVYLANFYASTNNKEQASKIMALLNPNNLND